MGRARPKASNGIFQDLIRSFSAAPALQQILAATVALVTVSVTVAGGFVLATPEEDRRWPECGIPVICAPFERQNLIPTLVSEDTPFYLGITPTLEDVPNLDRLRTALPEWDLQEGEAVQNEGLGQWVEEELGVDFVEDVAPWIGNEGALVADSSVDVGSLFKLFNEGMGITSWRDQGVITLVLRSRDNGKAEAMLRSVQEYVDNKPDTKVTESEVEGVTIFKVQRRSDNQEFFAFALIRDHVVFSSDSRDIVAMRDRQEDESLASNADFQKVYAELPEDTAGYLFVNGEVAKDFARRLGAVGGIRDIEAVNAKVEEWSALRGIGLSLSLQERGLLFSSVYVVDMARLSAAVAEQLQSRSLPSVSPALATVHADALMFWTYRQDLPPAPTAPISVTENLSETTAVALSSPEWEDGENMLVVMPNDGLIPVSTYRVLASQSVTSSQITGDHLIALMEEYKQNPLFNYHTEPLDGATQWEVAEITVPLVGTGVPGSRFAYAKNGNVTIIASDQSAQSGFMETLAEDNADERLNENGNFDLLMEGLFDGELPYDNSGLFYVNVDATADTVGNWVEPLNALMQFQIGMQVLPDWDVWLQPFSALMMTQTPGFSPEGVHRSDLFLLIP